MGKTLIAYYSRAGENYVSGSLRWLERGNTLRVAEQIATLTGGDLYEIRQKTPYAEGYNDCIEEARRDKEADARPAIFPLPEDLAAYDTVYLGYPNYWGTVPMAVCTFLTSGDFSGKTIRPFYTHEGSGLGTSVRDIRRLCGTANVKEGLAVHGSRIAGAEKTIEGWVKEI